MARRRAIEADELFETADRLQAEGKEVTATSLLDALGGGSLRTIYKLLEIWQQRRPAMVVTTSDEIPPSVQAAFAMTWRQAAQEAGREVLAVKEKAAEEVAAAVKQFQDALDAIEKMEKESEADAQQIESLSERVAALETSLNQSQAECAAFRAAGDQLQRQVASQEAELKRLHVDLDKQRTNHQEELDKVRAAQATAQSKAALQIEELGRTIAEAQVAAQKLESEKSEAVTRQGEMQKQLEKVEAASKADREERDTAIKQASELRGQVEVLKEQNSDLISKLGRNDNKK